MSTRKKSVYSLGGLLLLSLMLLLLAPAQGQAATFTVNSTADVAGLACNGIGTCTLRSAVQAANASLGVPDTIILSAGTYTLTIPGAGEIAAATGDLNITGLGGALTITGADAATTIIDGGALDGVFETRVGANVTISGVTIRNGNNIGGLGGGIHVGAGTTVVLNNAVVTACKSVGAAAGAGGVDNSGTLTMNTVAVTNNDSPGGGVNNGAAGVLTWTNGEVSGNINSDIVNAGGGGIQNKGTITLTNITISGNRSSGQGAGIDSIGTVTLQNDTIAGNTSTAAVAAIGGVRNNAGVLVTVRNTIISGNAPANCGGVITSQGNNIDNGNTCLFAGPGDLPNTDPKLVALANNGGAVQTHALSSLPLPLSPAIDAGSATVCPPTDARGIARPVDGNPVPPAVTAICDIGAFEFRPQKIVVTPASPINFGTVTNATTLDQTITVSNAGDGALAVGALAVANPLAAPFSILTDTCTAPVPRAGNCTIVMRFAPTAIAAASDAFDIPSNDPVTPTVTFALSGAGSAVPVPLISVTDSIAPGTDNTLPFPGVTIGLTSDATVTVTNTGTADLIIGTTVAPVAPFSITADTCSGKTLAASSACSLTVRFAPTANSAVSATLSIPTNIIGTPSVTISLSGSGISTTGNNPPSQPVLVTPSPGQTGVPTTMTFVWNKAVDPDGDALTYHFNNCTDLAMTTGCTPADVTAAAPSRLFFAGLGSFGAGIILIGFVAGSGLKRSRMTMFLITFLLLSGTLFMSCHKSSSEDITPTAPGTAAGQISNIVKNLTPNTTYYWKVGADDGKGGLASSEVRSYTTAQ